MKTEKERGKEEGRVKEKEEVEGREKGRKADCYPDIPIK